MRTDLGAHWDGRGVDFNLASRHAEDVDLCLFDHPDDTRAVRRVAMTALDDVRWHVRLDDVRPGQLYGYRVRGPYSPQEGHRFNAAKLLVDPYARAITGGPQPEPSIFGVDHEAVAPALSYNGTDSGGAMPKCVVVDAAFAWGDDAHPRTPWSETLIYEAHVRGLTLQHPDVPKAHRGTYAGLAAPAIIDHLKRLGVTAIELLPVHQIADEGHLTSRNLTNYWGYSTLGFFAPHAGYAVNHRGGQVDEFKSMVKAMHAAGIEVLLDVVYNHTAEGNHLGPTLSLKGIDNRAYYRLMPHNRSRYADVTGCGNTLDLDSPLARRLVLDSLRYWVEEMRVDGFRFDLAPALGRTGEDHEGRGRFRLDAPFFEELMADPVLARTKLIAEPWDVGPGGYRVGDFPPPWREWNDRFRDTARRFWRGDTGVHADFATRLMGSSDLFGRPERGPTASVNFVACHDGFTLADTTAYAHKHNEANGEDNRDGHGHNCSHSWGVEGPTDDPAILALRARAQRNLIATLFLAQGVPMLGHGDELGRTQGGNNNAYCQDNETSWVDWDLDEAQRALLAYVGAVAQLRRHLRPLRHQAFPVGEGKQATIRWLRPDGEAMQVDDWRNSKARGFAIHLVPRAEPVAGEEILLLLNNGPRPVAYKLPKASPRAAGGPSTPVIRFAWQRRLDTGTGIVVPSVDDDTIAPAAASVQVEGYALVLLTRHAV
ncbi:MAG: glycogen debranching protein GlgX [Acidobacteriota bacterium]